MKKNTIRTALTKSSFFGSGTDLTLHLLLVLLLLLLLLFLLGRSLKS